METGGACRGGETAILIGGAKMHDEVGEGFAVLGFGTPIAAGNIEETGGKNKIVAEANHGGGGGSVIAGGGETDAVVELSEELINRRGGMPWGVHSQRIGVQLDLGDRSPRIPKVGKDGEAGDTTQAEFRISEAA